MPLNGDQVLLGFVIYVLVSRMLVKELVVDGASPGARTSL